MDAQLIIQYLESTNPTQAGEDVIRAVLGFLQRGNDADWSFLGQPQRNAVQQLTIILRLRTRPNSQPLIGYGGGSRGYKRRKTGDQPAASSSAPAASSSAPAASGSATSSSTLIPPPSGEVQGTNNDREEDESVYVELLARNVNPSRVPLMVDIINNITENNNNGPEEWRKDFWDGNARLNVSENMPMSHSAVVRLAERAAKSAENCHIWERIALCLLFADIWKLRVEGTIYLQDPKELMTVVDTFNFYTENYGINIKSYYYRALSLIKLVQEFGPGCLFGIGQNRPWWKTSSPEFDTLVAYLRTKPEILHNWRKWESSAWEVIKSVFKTHCSDVDINCPLFKNSSVFDAPQSDQPNAQTIDPNLLSVMDGPQAYPNDQRW